MASPPPMQRIGPLVGLRGVLASFGMPLDKVLGVSGVAEIDFQPDKHLPFSIISEILDRAADLSGCAEIGLLVGQQQNQGALGQVGQLLMSCETLGSALRTYVGVQMANSTAAASYLHPVGEDFSLGFGVYGRDLPSNHVYDLSAATGCNMVRDLTGGAVAPLECLLSRPVPRNPDLYRRFFGCPVHFNAGETCLILPRRGMAFRLPTADAARRDNLLRDMQQKLSRDAPSFAALVKHALRPLLITGRSSQKDVSAHLNVHPRTLGRRLEKENATFEALKDEVRLAVARELLARTDIDVSGVAAALGYATPSAFVRAFRRWTGTSPTAWRQAA